MTESFVAWFRHAAPYVHAHRGRTFVIAFGGEAVADGDFAHLVEDLALLHGLGVRLVVAFGARPQIERRMAERKLEPRYVGGIRVTDESTMPYVLEAAGRVALEMGARFSLARANSPMAGAQIRVASGNFVLARPVGIRKGVDYGRTGEVRRIDADAIRQRLDSGAMVLLPPIGVSPTGEAFNLTAHDVGAAAAIALRADKLVCLVEGKPVVDTRRRLLRELTPGEAQELLARSRLPDDTARHLAAAIAACNGGVRRAHLVGRPADGAILRELFTRDGVGTMVTSDVYDDARAATLDDVPGILRLIEPLEREGILVHRPRETVERDVDRFTVMERDGTVIACAALYPYATERAAELACVAVHSDYRDADRGDVLLGYLERRAREQGIDRLFVLTTRTAHWFLERGFRSATIADLPQHKQALYNFQRKSLVYRKPL